MNVEVEEISATERKFVVEVTGERVTSEFDRAYADVARHATVKGFRKGKVPRAVLERQFGEEVRGQVTQILVQEGFSHALDESKLDVVSQPSLDFDPPVSGTEFRFSAQVEIRPELGKVDVDGLVVQRPSSDVSGEEVEKVLEQIRERHAQLEPVEDRQQVARGDFATVAIEAKLEGTTVEALSVEAGTVEVAAGHLPEAVDEQLALAKVGEVFSVDAPAPEGAPEELKGKTLAYAVTVKSLSEKKLPTLDDEFAKDHGDCDSLDEMRATVREQLEAEAERRADGAVREAIVDTILDRTDFAPPASMVSGRVESLLREFALELAQQGMRLTSGDHEDEAREKLQPRAEREVRANILLDHLAEQLGVDIEEDAVTAEVRRIVESAGPQADQAREHFAEESNRESLRMQLSRSRTLEELASKADVTEIST